MSIKMPLSTENLILNNSSEFSVEESFDCSSFGLEYSTCICEENRCKCLLDRGYIFKNILEKAPSELHNPEFGEQFGDDNSILHSLPDRTEFHANTIPSTEENFVTETGISQDYLNRINEKVEWIGFRNIHKQNSGNNMQPDLYYQWFQKNYIMEEMKSRLDSTNDSDKSAYLGVNCSENIPGNNCEKYSVEDKSDEYSRDVEDKDVLDIANAEDSFQVEVFPLITPDKRQVNSSLSVNLSSIAPRSEFFSKSIRLQENFENNREGYNLKLLARNIEILKEILKYLDEKERHIGGFGEHGDCKYNKIKSVKKDSGADTFTICQKSERKQKVHDFSENVNEVENVSLDITNQKANFVIFTYRIMCLKFERAFIRPYANVLAPTFELISFIFFLFACVFFFIFDRIHVLITKQRCMNPENSTDNSDAQQSSSRNLEEHIVSRTPSDIRFKYENILSEKEETAFVSLTLKENENTEKNLHISSWIKVEPKEIDVVSVKYDSVVKNVKNLHKNVELSSTTCNSEKQHRATIRTNADFVADFEFITDDDDDNEESELVFNRSDFDMEIIASSKTLSAYVADNQEIDNSYDTGKYLNQYGIHFGYKPTAKSKSNSFLPFENSFNDENPILNSTGYEIAPIYNHENSLDFGSSNMENNEDSFQMQVCPRKSTEEKFGNSSLSVNLSSISTDSDILSETERDNSENLPNDYDHESAAFYEYVKNLDKIRSGLDKFGV